MGKYAQLQYQGLNLLDEVGTVEIAIDYENFIIHIYDTQQIVAPEYHFATKNYQLTDSFYKMAALIQQKKFLAISETISIEEWVEHSTWYFYEITPLIKRYANGIMRKESLNSSKWHRQFYRVYTDRLL